MYCGGAEGLTCELRVQNRKMNSEPVITRQPMPISMRKGVVVLLIICGVVLLPLSYFAILDRSYLFHTDGL